MRAYTANMCCFAFESVTVKIPSSHIIPGSDMGAIFLLKPSGSVK